MESSVKFLICSMTFIGINASVALAASKDSVNHIVRVPSLQKSIKATEVLNDSKFVFKPGDVNSRMPVLSRKDNCVAIPNLYQSELSYFALPALSLKRDSISKRPALRLSK